MTDGGPVRIGVLGCASIAERRVLPALCRAEAVTLAAVASRDPAKAARFAERFGCEAAGGYAGLLDDPGIEAVYLPLPTGLHEKWAERALTAGKHVLVEKPLATGARGAARLFAQAREAGLVLMENLMFVRHSQHRQVAALVESEIIGELREMTAEFGIPPLPDDDIRYARGLGGGALLDMGVYPVRAAQFHLGGPLDVAGGVRRFDTARGVDLSCTAVLVSPNGVPARIAVGCDRGYRAAYTLWGAEGRITVDRAFTPPPEHRPAVRIERQDVTEIRHFAADDHFLALVRRFAGAVRGTVDTADDERQTLDQATTLDALATRTRRIPL
ncbi:Gfo/Idh/MocA family oxidoreductase [Streptomyces sp. GD-15H]|uniref:Gfo/Idh/MocA family protein n=1 Tax=Streptomyces sp. GD-15H TaxID=3129112 RepID=UPI003255C639